MQIFTGSQRHIPVHGTGLSNCAHQDIFADYALKCPTKTYYATDEQAERGRGNERFDYEKIVRIVKQLTDSESLAQIARQADCTEMHSAAAKQLHRQNKQRTLAEIAAKRSNSQQIDTNLEIVDMLTDMDALEYLTKNAKSPVY